MPTEPDRSVAGEATSAFVGEISEAASTVAGAADSAIAGTADSATAGTADSAIAGEIARAEWRAARFVGRDRVLGPQIVIAVAIVLGLTLPEQLTVGPTWLLPAVEALLLATLVLATPQPMFRTHPARRKVAMGMIGFVSAVNAVSLALLVHALLHHGIRASQGEGYALIRSGASLWINNVLLFGIWYWELDRGGPAARVSDPETLPDFLFPQMTEREYAPRDWSPKLVDYLYVSFTNATAFSPTDTMPLTPTAKWLMSGQSLISLVTVGLVVARAVNILQ